MNLTSKLRQTSPLPNNFIFDVKQLSPENQNINFIIESLLKLAISHQFSR